MDFIFGEDADFCWSAQRYRGRPYVIFNTYCKSCSKTGANLYS